MVTIKEFQKRQKKELTSFIFNQKLALARFRAKQIRALAKLKKSRMPTVMRTAKRSREK